MDNIRDIQKALAKLQEKLAQETGETGPVFFSEFAASYLATKLKNSTLRAATKRSFEGQVRVHLMPAFGALRLDQITNEVWLSWVEKTRGAPGMTRFFNARKVLNEILLAAKEAGHIDRKPSLDSPDELKDVGRLLADSEVWSVIRNTTHKIFRLLWFVLWKTGIRPREVLSWEWSMFAWNEPGHTWINVPSRITKTARTRRIPLNPSVSRHLYRRYLRRGADKFVFQDRKKRDMAQFSYHGAWRTACGRAGVKNAVVYDFRRTFITNAAAKGMPLIYIAKLLDTSTIMIEKIYAKGQPEIMEKIVSEAA